MEFKREPKKKIAYIEYPILIECGLKCRKCFHHRKWKLEREDYEKSLTDFPKQMKFTHEDFVKWRTKHLSDYDGFLVELQGGECSFGDNIQLVFEIIDTLGKDGKTKFQIQSNGLGSKEFYRDLLETRGGVIDRIGFTYHRDEFTERSDKENETLNEIFYNNADYVKKLTNKVGIHFYIKEILIPKYKMQALRDKTYWEKQGIEFRFQDYKGDGGKDGFHYSQADYALLHPEYRHLRSTCACREHYGIETNLIVRGYDYFAGDVIACWHDPVAIGNIIEDWYRPGATVYRDLMHGIKVDWIDDCKDVDVKKSKEHVSKAIEDYKMNGDKEAFMNACQYEIDLMKDYLKRVDGRCADLDALINKLRDRGNKMIGGILSIEKQLGMLKDADADQKLVQNIQRELDEINFNFVQLDKRLEMHKEEMKDLQERGGALIGAIEGCELCMKHAEDIVPDQIKYNDTIPVKGGLAEELMKAKLDDLYRSRASVPVHQL